MSRQRLRLRLSSSLSRSSRTTSSFSALSDTAKTTRAPQPQTNQTERQFLTLGELSSVFSPFKSFATPRSCRGLQLVWSNNRTEYLTGVAATAPRSIGQSVGLRTRRLEFQSLGRKQTLLAYEADLAAMLQPRICLPPRVLTPTAATMWDGHIECALLKVGWVHVQSGIDRPAFDGAPDEYLFNRGITRLRAANS